MKTTPATPVAATAVRVAILFIVFWMCLLAVCATAAVPSALFGVAFVLLAKRWSRTDANLAAYCARIDREHE